MARNDFNGDGLSDILWRANDGQFVIWRFDVRSPSAPLGRLAFSVSVNFAWASQRSVELGCE